MNKSNYNSYKSSLLMGEENSLYANKLTQAEIENARKRLKLNYEIKILKPRIFK